MFEVGIWKEKGDEKRQTVVQCEKCKDYHKFADKDSVEEVPQFVSDVSEAGRIRLGRCLRVVVARSRIRAKIRERNLCW